MKKNNLSKKIDSSLLSSIFLLILLVLLILQKNQYHLSNGDSISYFNITNHYLAFDWNKAVNAYWSPLLSWLLIPFFLLGIAPIIACNILNLIFGVIGLILVDKLIHILGIKSLLRTLTLLVVAFLFFQYNYSGATPDFLFLFFSLLLINLLLHPSFKAKYVYGIYTGLAGATLYFSKAFGLPLFVSGLFSVLFIYYLRSKDKQENIM